MIRGMIIRGMDTADLKAVFTMGQDTPGTDASAAEWIPEVISDVLVSSLDYCLVAVRRNSILGFVIPEIKQSGAAVTGEIIWLCAAEHFRDEIIDMLLNKLISQNTAVKSWEINLKKKYLSEYNILQKYGFADNSGFIRLKMDMDKFIPGSGKSEEKL